MRKHPDVDIEKLIRDSGAKVLRTDLAALLPDAPPMPPSAVEPGQVVGFHVLARPVPWKVPDARGRATTKDPSLSAWQDAVASHARRAMGKAAPFPGVVRLDFAFRLVQHPGRSLPDLTNLIKSTEDALQGTVIGNDRMVREVRASLAVCDVDGATIRVVAL